MLIQQLMDVAAGERTECIVMGLSGFAADTLQALDILQQVPEDRIVETLDEARRAANRLLAGPPR